MADDDEYYFEDDYDGGEAEAGEGEETWETVVENDYAEAKAVAETDLNAAISKFRQVIADDQDKGRWTFKSLKGIYRACTKHKDEKRMLEYYQKMLDFQWPDRTRNDIEKAINKFVDRCTQFPVETQREAYTITINAIGKDLRSYDKLWFAMKYKLAQLLLVEKRYDELQKAIEEMHVWCSEGDQAEQRKATQRLNVYSLEIQLWTARENPVKIRSVYQAAMSIKSAIPPPRVLGILRESGGKMFMRQSLWTEAHDCFLQAFRSFDEAGDHRRIACLKYLVLASMLSGSEINPFATNEAQSYQNDPEIVAMTELIAACQNNDLRQFDKVLKDKKNSRSILEDPFLYSYLEPLILKVRKQVLAVMAKPYQAVKLQFIANNLMLSLEDAESLCVAMILDGQLQAQIDQLAGVLRLNTSTKSAAAGSGARKQQSAKISAPSTETEGVRDRYALLMQLTQKSAQLHATVVNQNVV